MQLRESCIMSCFPVLSVSKKKKKPKQKQNKKTPQKTQKVFHYDLFAVRIWLMWNIVCYPNVSQMKPK